MVGNEVADFCDGKACGIGRGIEHMQPLYDPCGGGICAALARLL